MPAFIPQTIFKLFLLSIIVLPCILFVFYGTQEDITLTTLKAKLLLIEDYYNQHTLLTIILFALADMVLAAFSIPITAFMSIMAGALFDFWIALTVVSLTNSIGATVPFLISRYIARDMVQRHFFNRIRSFQQNIEQEGIFYLFGLRLTIFMPFWVVNLLMGITSIPLFTYFWVTLVATIPIKMLYIIAGQELTELKTFSDIVSPETVLLFTALGFMPLVTRKLSHVFFKAKPV